MSEYEQIADRVLIPMSTAERRYLTDLLGNPTNAYKRLVLVLEQDGCEFPLQQAALMLRNSPGVARKLIQPDGAEGMEVG